LTRSFTVDEFAALEGPDFESVELVAGELVPLPSGSLLHSLLIVEFTGLLALYRNQHRNCRIFVASDIELSPADVRRPDVFLYLGERAQSIDLRENPTKSIPDIAIEVLSPSERAIEVNRKVHTYLSAGVKEVWLVDGDLGITQIHRANGIEQVSASDELVTPLLPEFRLRLADFLS
jgi:Uma2 family endonuclease